MNFIEKLYCNKCKEDFERMDLGYGPQNNCNAWRCKVLSGIEFIIFLPIALVFSILMAPLLLGMIIYNKVIKDE